MVERLSYTQMVPGSSPGARTRFRASVYSGVLFFKSATGLEYYLKKVCKKIDKNCISCDILFIEQYV